MKLFFLLLFIVSTERCFSQDSTFILKKIYESKLPKRLFRLKDTSNNNLNTYFYVKENRRPYRVNVFQIGNDTGYNFIFVDSSLFFCALMIRRDTKKKHTDFYQYWVYNKRLFPLVRTRKKLNIDDNHLFILAIADQIYFNAELFLLNH